MVKPNFFIIGAQKAGSTFVQQVLAEHPEVFLVPGEIPFWEDPDYLNSDIKDFEQLFNSVNNEKAIGIKRPTYYAKTEVPERLYNYCPDAKLILVIRNPIERCVSAYFHYMKGGFIPIKNIETGLPKLISHDYEKDWQRANEIIQFGFYYQHLMHYLKYFKLEQINITLFDDIKEKPLETIQNILKFLGVTENHGAKSLSERPQAVVYSLPSIRILRLRHQLLYRHNKDRTRTIPKNSTFLEKSTAQILMSIHDKIISKLLKNEKPKLSPSLKQTLNSIYHNDIESLSQLIQRDLKSWHK